MRIGLHVEYVTLRLQVLFHTESGDGESEWSSEYASEYDHGSNAKLFWKSVKLAVCFDDHGSESKDRFD